MKKKILLGSVIALILAPLLAFGVFYTITNPKFDIPGWADMDSVRLEKYSEPVTVCDIGGNGLISVSSSGNSLATFEELPPPVINAFIAAEDKRFYDHSGVDYYRILGAAAANIRNFGIKEGASTITQQLAKNTHLSSEKTFSRKIKEIRIARGIELNYTKDEILLMYLNALYFGNNIYGITDAANYYFGKPVTELDAAESATLAAVINSPAYFDPYTHPENTLSRRNLILSRMRQQGYIDEETCLTASTSEIVLSYAHSFPQYQYFVTDEAGLLTNNSKKPEKLYSGINTSVQEIVENAVLDAGITDELVMALVLDVKTGRLTAAAASTVADLSTIQRQPGSTIKPIISYAPALENNHITPITMLDDSPATFGDYAPENYNEQYYGWVTAEESLSRSLNIPAVKLLEINGIKKSKDFARKMGIKMSDNDDGLAIALGGLSDGVTLKDLAGAYACFARGGKYIKPTVILPGGTSLKTKAAVSPNAGLRVMHNDTAFFINKMLSTCAKTGTAKKLSGIENIAAKTGTVGTSEGNSDVYCIAYNENYVTAVWIGAKQGVMSENILGGGKPAAICAEIMKNPIMRSGEFTKPSSVVTLEIDLSEYEKMHKLVIAGDELKMKDRLSAEFSVRNLPISAKRYRKQNGSYGSNFKIVDDFSE